ncbi:MAG TPA: hypothetical protein VHF47_12345 [Acidimicrobiales bacterium]|nr:hypothetical protein [Acidimicrobiales bacterium]
MQRRLAVIVFLVVALAGQLAVGMRASTTASTTGDEPFYLLTAQSLKTDGDLDLRDEYRNREYRRFWDGRVELWKQMTPAPDGRLLAPHDPGLPLLVLPAYAAGGLRGVQRFLVLLWAAAMAVGALLALRAGAPPWAATLAAVAVGAGTPGVVYASQVYPEGTAAFLVGLALLLATGERARPFALAAVLVALAWLGVKYVPLGALAALVHARRHGVDKRALAVLAVAGAHYLWWHLDTFGGLTPYSTNVVWSGEGDSSILADHVDWSGRSYRLYGLFLDARFGLFRWLPIAVLALWGLRRLHAGVVAICVLMGTFVSITMMGWWFPGRMLIAGFASLVVLVALGAARLPRPAVALGAWSLAVAVALVVAARTGDVRLAVDPFALGFPLAPAALFPDFRTFGARQIALSSIWAAALTMLLWRSSFSSTATRWRTERSSPFRPTWRLHRAR